MVEWKKYPDLEPIRRFIYKGRELLGEIVLLTEKRDGENVSIWLDDEGNPHISSRRMKEASIDIQQRMKKTPEWKKVLEMLRAEREFGKDVIVYGELLKHISPTRIEPKRKHIHWIMFDIYDPFSGRFLPYEYVFQRGYQFKIPVVRVFDRFVPETMDELMKHVKDVLKQCKRRRREGIVGKVYNTTPQVFFKEKIDLPELPKIKKDPNKVRPQYPPMPEEKILRALAHAYDEIASKYGEDKADEIWMDRKITMPIIAKHISAEAREHRFKPPKNYYWWYVNTPLEKIKGEYV